MSDAEYDLEHDGREEHTQELVCAALDCHGDEKREEYNADCVGRDADAQPPRP